MYILVQFWKHTRNSKLKKKTNVRNLKLQTVDYVFENFILAKLFSF